MTANQESETPLLEEWRACLDWHLDKRWSAAANDLRRANVVGNRLEVLSPRNLTIDPEVMVDVPEDGSDAGVLGLSYKIRLAIYLIGEERENLQTLGQLCSELKIRQPNLSTWISLENPAAPKPGQLEKLTAQIRGIFDLPRSRLNDESFRLVRFSGPDAPLDFLAWMRGEFDAHADGLQLFSTAAQKLEFFSTPEREGLLSEITKWVRRPAGEPLLCVRTIGSGIGSTALAKRLIRMTSEGTLTDYDVCYIPLRMKAVAGRSSEIVSTMASAQITLPGVVAMMTAYFSGRSMTDEPEPQNETELVSAINFLRGAVQRARTLFIFDGYTAFFPPDLRDLEAVIDDEPLMQLFKHLFHPVPVEGDRYVLPRRRHGARYLVLGDETLAGLEGYRSDDLTLESPDLADFLKEKPTSKDRPDPSSVGDQTFGAFRNRQYLHAQMVRLSERLEIKVADRTSGSAKLRGLAYRSDDELGLIDALATLERLERPGKNQVSRLTWPKPVTGKEYACEKLAGYVVSALEAPKKKGAEGVGAAFLFILLCESGMRLSSLRLLLRRWAKALPAREGGKENPENAPSWLLFTPPDNWRLLEDHLDALCGVISRAHDAKVPELDRESHQVEAIDYPEVPADLHGPEASVLYRMRSPSIRNPILARLEANPELRNYLGLARRLLAEESLRQHHIMMRHTSQRGPEYLRAHRRLLEGLRHGMLGLFVDRGLLQRVAGRLPGILPHPPEVAVVELLGRLYSRVLDGYPALHVSRLFNAERVRSNLFQIALHTHPERKQPTADLPFPALDWIAPKLFKDPALYDTITTVLMHYARSNLELAQVGPAGVATNAALGVVKLNPRKTVHHKTVTEITALMEDLYSKKFHDHLAVLDDFIKASRRISSISSWKDSENVSKIDFQFRILDWFRNRKERGDAGAEPAEDVAIIRNLIRVNASHEPLATILERMKIDIAILEGRFEIARNATSKTLETFQLEWLWPAVKEVGELLKHGGTESTASPQPSEASIIPNGLTLQDKWESTTSIIIDRILITILGEGDWQGATEQELTQRSDALLQKISNGGRQRLVEVADLVDRLAEISALEADGMLNDFEGVPKLGTRAADRYLAHQIPSFLLFRASQKLGRKVRRAAPYASGTPILNQHHSRIYVRVALKLYRLAERKADIPPANYFFRIMRRTADAIVEEAHRIPPDRTAAVILEAAIRRTIGKDGFEGAIAMLDDADRRLVYSPERPGLRMRLYSERSKTLQKLAQSLVGKTENPERLGALIQRAEEDLVLFERVLNTGYHPESLWREILTRQRGHLQALKDRIFPPTPPA